MLRDVIDKMFNSHHGTLFDYSGQALTKMNGRQQLLHGEWKDVLIDGHALLGGWFERTIVVNGDCKAIHADFDILDVRGKFEIHTVAVNERLILQGAGKIEQSTLARIDLICRGDSILKDSAVGNIVYTSGSGMLILENTKVVGAIHVTKANRDKVKIIGDCSEIAFKEIER
jgi:hypothetical protein